MNLSVLATATSENLVRDIAGGIGANALAVAYRTPGIQIATQIARSIVYVIGKNQQEPLDIDALYASDHELRPYFHHDVILELIVRVVALQNKRWKISTAWQYMVKMDTIKHGVDRAKRCPEYNPYVFEYLWIAVKRVLSTKTDEEVSFVGQHIKSFVEEHGAWSPELRRQCYRILALKAGYKTSDDDADVEKAIQADWLFKSHWDPAEKADKGLA